MDNLISDVDRLLYRKSRNKYFSDKRFEERKRNLKGSWWYSYVYYSTTVEPNENERIYCRRGHTGISVAYEPPKHVYKLFKPVKVSWRRHVKLKRFYKKYAHRVVRHQGIVSYGSGKMSYKHECGIAWLID